MEIVIYLALWSTTIVTLILRGALQFDKDYDRDSRDRKEIAGTSVSLDDQDWNTTSFVYKADKEDNIDPKDTPNIMEKVKHSNNDKFIMSNSEIIKSPPTTELYASEATKTRSMI